MIDDGVEVKRTIEERPNATVVMYRLETVTSTPSVVRLEETIPPEDRIETLEFHPNHRPNDWTIGEETVQFDVMIPPNETRSVVLGIDADAEEVFGREEPMITNLDSETIELDESTESVPLTRGGDTGSTEDDASNVLGLDTDTVADGSGAVEDAGVDAAGEDTVDTVVGDASAGPDSDAVPDSDDPTEVGLDPAKEGPEQSSDIDNSDDIDDSDDTEDPAEDVTDGDANDGADTVDDVDVVDATTGEPVVEETVESADVDESADSVDTAETPGMVDTSVDSQAGDGTEDGTEDGIGIESDNDDPGSADGFDGLEPAEPVERSQVDSATAADAGSATAGDGESLVGNLLTEIEAGYASEGELDALRSELGVARADEVRFRHVQSRMDDFEAYVDALEGIINSHGTASEFVDSIEREVTDLQDQISAVRSEVRTVDDELEAADGEREQLTEEVSAVDERVAELDETVTGLSDEVAELTDLVGTVDDRTATLEADLREELDDVREELDEVRDERDQEVERIETELETVREQLESDFETEFDSLREDVESLNEVRRSLLDAFGGGLDPTIDDDSTVSEES